MSLRALSFYPFAFAGLVVLGTAAGADAQLAAKSPFMPPQAVVNAAPTVGAPLEYRGIMETSEGVQFRIYDPVKKIGAWVKANERNPDFDVMVKQHDNGQKTLTIEHQGKTLTLAEREPKVVSSGSAAQAMPPPVAPVQSNVAPAVTQSVVLNPNAADEQRRLDAVAAEVARRRALREQANQQVGQPQTPQVNVPQPAVQPQGNFQPGPQRTYQPPTGPGQAAPRQR
jgi:hypothetical protein